MKRLMATASVMIITGVAGLANFYASQAQQFTPEQRSQMCDSNNPKLNFVNSTESEICGISESVKNQTTLDNSTAATPSSITPSAVPQ
jgi:cytoskeletal protein RodZ